MRKKLIYFSSKVPSDRLLQITAFDLTIDKSGVYHLHIPWQVMKRLRRIDGEKFFTKRNQLAALSPEYFISVSDTLNEKVQIRLCSHTMQAYTKHKIKGLPEKQT